ncbi:hypothetical protein CR513_37876, partial [Mucuna pruriens]
MVVLIKVVKHGRAQSSMLMLAKHYETMLVLSRLGEQNLATIKPNKQEIKKSQITILLFDALAGQKPKFTSDFVQDVDDRKKILLTLYLSWVNVLLVGTLRNKSLLHFFTCEVIESTKIHIDKKFSQVLANNSVLHELSKHINTRYHSLENALSRKRYS